MTRKGVLEVKKICSCVFAIIVVLTVGFSLTACSSKTNEKAEKDTAGRYLTIINKTEQVINEVHVYVGEGTEIESMEKENPDETSFSIKIPVAYAKYSEFIVELIDRYGLKYQKEVQNVGLLGRTEVVISEDDYVKQNGDFWNKVDQFFNGD
ncbi:MAG: hypothetical protein IJO24_02895 [Clostridia bacterium]|nr:hypothetical protein [Clostridia bacterium]